MEQTTYILDIALADTDGVVHDIRGKARMYSPGVVKYTLLRVKSDLRLLGLEMEWRITPVETKGESDENQAAK